MQNKLQKRIFLSEIIAYGLVSLIVSMKKRMLVMVSQCVNKQS